MHTLRKLVFIAHTRSIWIHPNLFFLYWWCSRHLMHVFRIAPHQIEFCSRHSKLGGLVLCIVWSMLFPCSFLFMGAVFDITFRFSQMFEFQQYFMVLIIYLYRCARDGVFLRNSEDELRTQKKPFFFCKFIMQN